MHDVSYVLVVDDDRAMARLVSQVLVGAGFEVGVALNPADALAHVVERVPDVVVTDFEMPGMNGAALMEQVREMLHTTAPPAVLISGALDAVHPRQQALFTAELSKPFRPAELRAAVALCMEAAEANPKRKQSGTRMRAVGNDENAAEDESQTG